MAKYEKQATGKYYGLGSGGKVYTNTQSDGLAKSLANAGYLIGQGENKKIDREKTEAMEKIQTLYASGKSFETIQSEILEGKHPDLVGKYTEATTNFHLGKVKAAETIIEINNNKDDYDHTTMTLDSFYKKFMPDDLANQDPAYSAGFSTKFNIYKEKEANSDAEVRAAHNTKVKIEEVRKILSVIPTEDIDERYVSTWKAFGHTLRTKDNKGKTEFYTNAELMAAIISDVASIIDTATTADQLARAEKIMSLDLGLGKNNQKLGTLNSRKNKDVDILKTALEQKKVSVENQRRRDEVYETGKAIDAIWIKSMTAKEDGTMPTVAELQEMSKEIATLAGSDITYVQAFQKYHNTDPSDRVISSPKDTSRFILDIHEGRFQTYAEMVAAWKEQELPNSVLDKAQTEWGEYQQYGTKNKPIYETNSNYTSQIKRTIEVIKDSYTNNVDGTSQEGDAIDDATIYMHSQILEWERGQREKGITVTEDDRRKFIIDLGKYAKETWVGTNPSDIVPESVETRRINKETELLNQELEADEAKEQEIRDNTVLFTQDEGTADAKDVTLGEYVDQISNTINELGNVKLSKIRIGGIISEKELYNQVNLPKITKYITSALGDNFDENVMAAMSDEDYINIVNQMAQNLGLLKGSDEEDKKQLINLNKIIQSIVTGER